MEIEELRKHVHHQLELLEVAPTLTVPSNVEAITVLFSASEARPVMLLILPPDFPVAPNRPTASGGQAPTSKVFRFIPDWRFHISIEPVEEPAIPKLPQAVTQTH